MIRAGAWTEQGRCDERNLHVQTFLGVPWTKKRTGDIGKALGKIRTYDLKWNDVIREKLWTKEA